MRAGEPPTTVLPIPLSFCESITSLSPSHAQCRTYGVGDLRGLLCPNLLRAGPLDVTCTAANQAQSSFPAGPGCGQGVSPEPEATAALLLLAARILADLPGLPRSPGEALSHPSVPIPLVPVLPHLVRVPACAAASKSHRTPLPGCTKAPSSQRASHHCACHTPGCHKKFVRGHQLVATKCTRDRSASQALSAPGASPALSTCPSSLVSSLLPP